MGKSRFQDIQHYEGDTNNLKLKYYVFDLLSLDGHDLRGMELLKRKQLLKNLINAEETPDIIYHDHIEAKGVALLK